MFRVLFLSEEQKALNWWNSETGLDPELNVTTHIFYLLTNLKITL